MLHPIHLGDIGTEQEEVEYEPLTVPLTEPVSVPVPEREPEAVPA